jgi:hypothetical protein
VALLVEFVALCVRGSLSISLSLSLSVAISRSSLYAQQRCCSSRGLASGEEHQDDDHLDHELCLASDGWCQDDHHHDADLG